MVAGLHVAALQSQRVFPPFQESSHIPRPEGEQAGTKGEKGGPTLEAGGEAGRKPGGPARPHACPKKSPSIFLGQSQPPLLLPQRAS